MTIEVAESETSQAIAATDAPIAETRDKGRFVAQALLPLGLVPPGEDVARAVVKTAGGTSVQLRPFRLARAVPAGQMFKAELATRVGSFQRADVLTPSLLGPAIARARELEETPLTDAATQAADKAAAGNLDTMDLASLSDDKSLTVAFLKGLQSYRAGKFEDAAREFRASVRHSSEFLPGIFYLGACYAAGGRGREAVGAWQTSLVGDDSSPDVFQLLVDGFLRLGDTEAAISTLEEAAAKWPDDYRFVRSRRAGRCRQGRARRGVRTAEALA